MNVPEKTYHSAQIPDVETLVSHCSVLVTLYNGAVRITIAYTILDLRMSRNESLRNYLWLKRDFQ